MKNIDDLIFEQVQVLAPSNQSALPYPDKKVLILSTARTGSNLFCDVLAHTGLCGQPQEWFKAEFFNAYMKLPGNEEANFQDYLKSLLLNTTSSNGVFSVKVHIRQILELESRGINILDLNFDHVVYLYRNNKVDQAVSLAKASKTGQWVSGIKGNGQAEVVANYEISEALNNILNMQNVYEEKYKHVVCDEYSYEDFSDQKNTKVFKRFFNLIGLDFSDIKIKTVLKKQSDSKSKRLSYQFMKYISNSK